LSFANAPHDDDDKIKAITAIKPNFHIVVLYDSPSSQKCWIYSLSIGSSTNFPLLITKNFTEFKCSNFSALESHRRRKNRLKPARKNY
jgi:hypothetical protein